MEWLFFINLLLVVLLYFYPLYITNFFLNNKNINPFSISLFTLFPLELAKLFFGAFSGKGNFFNSGFQFAIFITNLNYACYLIIAIIVCNSKLQKLYMLIPKFWEIKKNTIRTLSHICLICFFVVFFVLASLTGGILDWLSDVRYAYQVKRDGFGLLYAAALNFISLSYFCRGIVFDGLAKFSIYSFLYLLLVYALGSKGFVLTFAIYYCIVLLIFGKDKYKFLILFFLLFAFFLILLNFSSRTESIDLSTFEDYFDYYRNSSQYYEDYFDGRVNLFYGEVFISEYWNYVPRFIYPEKPREVGILKVVELYYPGASESGNTPAFNSSIDKFADFGVIGIIIFSFIDLTKYFYFSILLYVSSIIYKSNLFDKISVRDFTFICITFAPSFGSFLSLAYSGLFLLATISAAVLLQKLKII